MRLEDQVPVVYDKEDQVPVVYDKTVHAKIGHLAHENDLSQKAEGHRFR
jgi:hypothetical protein